MLTTNTFVDSPIPLGAEWVTQWDETYTKLEDVFSQFEHKEEIVNNIKSVDHSSEKVIVTNVNGNTYQGDKCICTASIQILRNKDITFPPDLPPKQRKALDNAPIYGGIKVFFKCKTKFFDAYTATPNGQGLWIDSTYHQ